MGAYARRANQPTRPRKSLAVLTATLAFTFMALGCDTGGSGEDAQTGEAAVTSAVKRGELTIYLVSASSEDVVERAMAYDLAARKFNYMGPEDFHYSIDKPGYPFVLFSLNGVSGIPAENTPLYEHEFTHMAAAATVKKLTGQPLAELMRPDGCSFSHRARFHEVCADYGRWVAPVYQSKAKMGSLLDTLGADIPPYARKDDYVGRLDTTGIDLVDAACLWDQDAMAQLEALYNDRAGAEGAFDALFPPQGNLGSCVEDQMERARIELGVDENGAPPPPHCRRVTASSLNVRRGPGRDYDRAGALARGARSIEISRSTTDNGAAWLRIVPLGSLATQCAETGDDRACWVHGDYVEDCN